MMQTTFIMSFSTVALKGHRRRRNTCPSPQRTCTPPQRTCTPPQRTCIQPQTTCPPPQRTDRTILQSFIIAHILKCFIIAHIHIEHGTAVPVWYQDRISLLFAKYQRNLYNFLQHRPRSLGAFHYPFFPCHHIVVILFGFGMCV